MKCEQKQRRRIKTQWHLDEWVGLSAPVLRQKLLERMESSEAVQKRFWSKISISEHADGCWIWKGALTAKGYGTLISWVGKKNVALAAHRISYYLKHKHLPPEALVCHHCDQPKCVNPDHLFLGTQAQNQFDKVNKFRQAHSEAHGRSILTAEDVQQIRVLRHFLNTSLPKLCKMYGVGGYAIEAILTGVNWKHLPLPACMKK